MAKRRLLNNGSPQPSVSTDPEEFPEYILPPSPDEDEHSKSMRKIMNDNWNYIRTHSHQGLFEDRYVIRLDSTDPRAAFYIVYLDG